MDRTGTALLRARREFLRGVKALPRADTWPHAVEMLIRLSVSADFGSAQARKRMFLVCDREGSTITRQELLNQGQIVRQSAHDIIEWQASYPTTLLQKPGRAKPTLERAERAIAELGPGVPFIIVYYGSDRAGVWRTLDAPL